MSDEKRTDKESVPPEARMVTAAAEAIEDVAIRLIGRDLGTLHRNTIVGAGLAAALHVLADEIDAGPSFPVPPSVISALIRERANDAFPPAHLVDNRRNP